MSEWFDQAKKELADQKESRKARDEAQQWEPDVGEVLQCIFIEAHWGNSPYGPGIIALVRPVGMDKYEGVKWLTVMAFPKQLREGFENMRPAKGSEMMIEYEGKFEPGPDDSWHAHHRYSVVAAKGDTEYWSKIWEEFQIKNVEASKPPEVPFTPPDESPF